MRVHLLASLFFFCPNLESHVICPLPCYSEECKTAAAYALGNVTVGNVTTFLPTILDALNKSKHQYLLLSALKEVIVCHRQKDEIFYIGPYVSQILPCLLKYCESPEEGVRNMVADCFGSLIVQNPTSFADILLRTSQGTSSAKWTMATALKYAVSSGVPLPEVGSVLPQVSSVCCKRWWSCIFGYLYSVSYQS